MIATERETHHNWRIDVECADCGKVTYVTRHRTNGVRYYGRRFTCNCADFELDSQGKSVPKRARGERMRRGRR